MVSYFRRSRLTVPVAPAAAVALGLLVALAALFIPAYRLESIVLASGLPAIVAAAEPPLGFTARLVLVTFGGGLVALFTWFGLFMVLGGRTISLGGATAGADVIYVPSLRRADAHPDAPPRAPLFAHRELGVPFLDVRAAPEPVPEPAPLVAADVEPRDLPADLDMPLASFDPVAFAAANGAAPRFGPDERIETFELTPIVRGADATSAPRAEPRDTEATITALLERLERGVSRRAEAAPSARPRDTALTTLRRIAAQG